MNPIGWFDFLMCTSLGVLGGVALLAIWLGVLWLY